MPYSEEDDELAFLLTMKPTWRPAAGRNEPCPCGSGKKYKQCCISKPSFPTAEQHALWLQRKLLRYACQPRFVPLLHDLLVGATGEDFDPEAGNPIVEELLEQGTVLWWLLFDGRLIDGFSKSHGYRLPPIESELLDDWRSRRLQLFDVVEVNPDEGYTLRDAHSGDGYFVAEPATTDHRGFDLLLAHVGKFGDGLRIIDVPIGVPPADRESALVLTGELRSTAIDVAIWFGQCGSRK